MSSPNPAVTLLYFTPAAARLYDKHVPHRTAPRNILVSSPKDQGILTLDTGMLLGVGRTVEDGRRVDSPPWLGRRRPGQEPESPSGLYSAAWLAR